MSSMTNQETEIKDTTRVVTSSSDSNIVATIEPHTMISVSTPTIEISSTNQIRKVPSATECIPDDPPFISTSSTTPMSVFNTTNTELKRSRRHHWQQKYEMELGLIAIERDVSTGDVTLAMCGFCKAFGREGKYEQNISLNRERNENVGKKRRRRSLTTTKFFRTFRVDNIRSHLLGAHPQRWSEYETLPKQESIRSKFLQRQPPMQLNGHVLNEELHNGRPLDVESSNTQSSSQVLSASLSDTLRVRTALDGKFDYEAHLAEQLAHDKAKLKFEKEKFAKDVELRERELNQHKERMVQAQRHHEEAQANYRDTVILDSAQLNQIVETVLKRLRDQEAPEKQTPL